ncbi:MAG: pyruvate kinase [Gammaproteobacteria bacterium]|nr:pyruvate kinase [Gammaproteobacteria bacterium]NIM73131.1 pyruvate kinase [Gammaproteobacteria bacterium]NIN38811.1 pyruvate kinase [Gammaproteobacteria bacterium]NIO24886.1 pyruvate kinase [Gammaproteobacteria bacterium]NIO65488.1 pyruvate kinase [Gammaproteobacteria bacterium]
MTSQKTQSGPANRLRPRRTKIIATIGPACDAEDSIEELIRAGMDVARLNLSHGSFPDHAARIERIRAAAERAGAFTAILVDTKGSEIRTGLLSGGKAELVPGESFELFCEPRTGDAAGVSVSNPGLRAAVQPGDSVLLDDGAIELRVEDRRGKSVRCTVVRGGVLRDSKGVNLPGAELQLSAEDRLTREDLEFAVEHRADYIAASFVQGEDDVLAIRKIVEDLGARIPIIAKIENRAAVANLESIVAAADGTMVARGDLGVEFPLAEVPAIQKNVIRVTVTNGKPVITATQMLDSMERNPRPTRAEVSDVANAILDGSSAVMLSGETAMGKHPVESVKTMSALALRAEASLKEFGQLQKILPHPSNVITEAVSQAAIAMADHLNGAAIISLTETGFTSRLISKYRPSCPIIAVTSSVDVVRRFSMNWGVHGLHYTQSGSDADKVQFAVDRAKDLGWVQDGDIVVATSGQTQQAGSTNLIRVVVVD